MSLLDKWIWKSSIRLDTKTRLYKSYTGASPDTQLGNIGHNNILLHSH